MNKRKSRNRDKKKKVEDTEPYIQEVIPFDDNVTKDFSFLVNAPVSEDDHFVFKSEKSWTVDVSKYSEYFTVDLNILSAVIESVPFTEIVEIQPKYFTSDQLTDIHNRSEKGNELYANILETHKKRSKEQTKEIKEIKENSNENLAEDLDFLLSLEEPVSTKPIKSQPPFAKAFTSESFAEPVSSKSVDLEKWLDSVLED